MKTIALNTVAERATGFTHLFKIKHTDLTAAATTQTLDLLALELGDYVNKAAFYLKTPFDGGATTNLTLDVGESLTPDADAFLDGYELHADGSEVLAGDGNGAAFATLRTGFVALAAGSVQALFTATGANMTALTQGEVWIYLNVARLPELS